MNKRVIKKPSIEILHQNLLQYWEIFNSKDKNEYNLLTPIAETILNSCE